MNSSVKVKLKPKPAVIGLPRNIQIEYCGKIDKEKFFVVWRPKKDDWDYKDLHLAVGPVDNLKSIRIGKVERFLDGGSTFIYTAIGKFFFAPWGKHEGGFEGQPFLEFYYSAYDDVY